MGFEARGSPRQQPLADEAAAQRIAVAISPAPQDCQFRIGGDVPDPTTKQQIVAAEEAGERHQVVGIGRQQRAPRVALRGAEGSSSALEIEDPG
jgi:hypothetical protein